MEYPSDLSAVHFIRPKLTHGDTPVLENFCWRGTEENNYTALRTLQKVNLEEKTRIQRQGNRWILSTEIGNPSKHPAVMVHLSVARAKSGDRIVVEGFNVGQ
jgi:hypothetical protein